MKLKALVISALAAFVAGFATVGCQQEQIPTEIEVSINPSTLNLDASAQDATVELTTTRGWKAAITYETGKDWLSLSAEKGEWSKKAQKITLTLKENTGRDRVAKIKFSIGLEDATLTVTQTGPGGSAQAVYFNDFDKVKSEKSGNYFPYAKDTDCWRNEQGSGIANISYVLENNDASIRSNSNSSGSGMNNWFFAKQSLFCVKGITLPQNQTNYTIPFLGIRNVYGTTSGDGKSIFDHNDFKLYVSEDGSKWVQISYAFEGGDPDNAWAEAKSTFTVPSGTKTLCFGVSYPSEASVYRLDDVKLDVAEAAGTAIDWSKGVAVSEFNGGSGSGTGGGTEMKGTPQGDGSQANPFNATAAILKAQEVGQTASTDFYYIKGFISSVKEISTSYGNASFYITDTKAADTDQFYCFQVAYLGGQAFTSTDQLKAGDEVVLYAQVVNYKGNTPETNGKSTAKLISINGNTAAGDYFGVSTTTISALYTDTSASFKVNSSVAWTASCDNAAFKISPASGSSDADVTVSFSANSEYTARTAKITVSTTAAVSTKSYEIVLVQNGAPDPNAKYVELTNAEIVAAVKGASSGYQDYTIASASGEWKCNANTNVKFLQIRNKNKSFITTPAFQYDIEKIEFVMASDATMTPQDRPLYLVPTTVTLPETKDATYTDALVATNYGMVSSKSYDGQTYTINLTSAQKQVTILSLKGAIYINSIKVYLKK